MGRIAINPPVKTKTIAGYDVTIFEIDCDDTDLLNGRVITPGMGDFLRNWNNAGICRDASEECNLDPRAPEVANLLMRARNECNGRA